MLMSDYITPVMYLDPSGEFFLEIAVSFIFVLATYALFPEVRPFLDPLFKNIEFTFGVGEGVVVSAFDTGVEFVTGYNGVICSLDACQTASNGDITDFTVYSTSTYYLDGVYTKSTNFGFGPIRFEKQSDRYDIYINIDFAATGDYAGVTPHAGMKINVSGIIEGYIDLLW